jgi:hypothetical protein
MKKIDFSSKVINAFDDKPFQTRDAESKLIDMTLKDVAAEGLVYINPQAPILGAEKIRRGELANRIFRHQRNKGYVELTTEECALLISCIRECVLTSTCSHVAIEMIENAPEMGKE